MDACHTVAAGGSVVDATIVQQLITARTAARPIASLTDREREALALMAEGRSNQAIASTLYVSGKTVETYIRSIFQKLDLSETPDDHRRVRAVLQWLQDEP